YTGSAGWIYQGLIRWFLGITKESDYLIIEPAVPDNFGDYIVKYKHGSSLYEIRVTRNKDDNLHADEIFIDGNRIQLVDYGKHNRIVLQI
ncbi:MAG: hypothetical protein GX796_11450, partial [Clostridiaceae bacterium]|nr:hypothetical protein [Clostridiaceae bacterium]